VDKRIKVNRVYSPYLSNKDRYLVLYGSAGSGKSVFAAQKIVLRIVSEQGHRFLVVRKVANTLRSSTYQLILDTIRDLDLLNEFEVNKTEMRFTHKLTGNEILMGGLDDVEKLKSIAGVTGVWIEEATELTSDDLDQIDLRMRGETLNYKQILLSFNPIDERHWLKKRFFDDGMEYCTILKTTYRDNNFLDEEYKRTLELKAKVNPNYYRIYVLGEWGREEVNRPFMYNFNMDNHVGETTVNDTPLIFSLDFNFDPFVCIVAQEWNNRDGHHLHVHNEIVLSKQGVNDMIRVIKGNYTSLQLSKAIFTGDATQRKRTVEQSVRGTENLHAWAMLDEAFKLGKRLRVPRANPKVASTQDICNFALSLHPDIKINPKCNLLINEMQFTECDADGNILKKDRNKLEQRADAIDAYRYLTMYVMPDIAQFPKKYGIKV
jgi:hypothetical protein